MSAEGGDLSTTAESDLPSGSLLGAFFDAQLKSRCALLLEARTHPLCAGVGEEVISYTGTVLCLSTEYVRNEQDLTPSLAATLASALRPAAEPVFIAQLQHNLNEIFSKEDSTAAPIGKQQVFQSPPCIEAI